MWESGKPPQKGRGEGALLARPNKKLAHLKTHSGEKSIQQMQPMWELVKLPLKGREGA